ncbi:MAG: ATP-binding protein, partial [Ignavibacteria bacterium]|nr:ATP-binding protein [Ignavibacteria bacterium]
EYLQFLFEPFTQEDTGHTRKFEGNGLALALVKKYAEMNNLSIDLKSEKGVGTEVFIVFN